MPFLVAGLNYRNASTELLERVSVNDRALPDLLLKLQQQLGETLVLSTCNRTEVYTTGDDLDVARTQLMQVLSDMTGLSEEEA
ncbi:MAG: glutamyl-tRNA reductase, partial [Chloroflexi bacterium]|nr:glutamyl-tRNA reductase [Chloroflexota bacterium]